MSVTVLNPSSIDSHGLERADRWRPSRAGLINVWRYQEEAFEFHRGRLLLRGPNGSGKSMALELLLPFLLDANASPSRLSSAAKSRGGLYDRMLAGRDSSGTTGFVWAEFVRGTGEDADVFTIGARMRASSASRRVTTDWFTTSLRIGDQLRLLDETRTPLSKQALADALGANGTVHTNAEDYRAAVRASLFPGFGDKQYDAIITALLALRREKVSQDLTPARLSEILTASLPPVDERDIAEIAEAFEKLDRHRDTIVALEQDLGQVRQLATRQRSYARTILLAQAKRVRTAETRRDDVTKRERLARIGLEETNAELERVATEDRAADDGIARADAEIDTLRNLDEYKRGGQLGPMQDQQRRLDDQATQSRQTVERHERAVADAIEARERTAQQEADATRNEEAAKRELLDAADRLNALDIVEQSAEQSDPERAGTLLEAWQDARRAQMDEIREARRSLERAVAERGVHERRVEEDRSALDGAVDARASAERELESVTSEYGSSVRAWISDCVILGATVLAERVPESPTDPEGVRLAVEARASEVRSALAVRTADLERQRAALDEQRAELAAERSKLEAGSTILPDAPSWRSPREDGPEQVPLWQLVDFRDECPAGDRAGIEAALLSAGLLDALVDPQGDAPLPPGVADAVLHSSTEALVAGASLADVLTPVEDAPIPRGVILRLLRSIAWRFSRDTDAVAVGVDGTFQLAILSGRGAPESPRFIGAAARERQRRLRIAEIDEALAAVGREASALGQDLDAVARESVALVAEVEALPSDTGVLAARAGVEVAHTRLGEAESRVRASEHALSDAERTVREAQRVLMVLGSQHGMPTDDAGLSDYAGVLETFGRRTSTWIRRRQDRDRARHDAEQAARIVSERETNVADARDTLAGIQRQLQELQARLDALERSVGAGFREIAGRIDASAREREELATRRRELATTRSELDRKLGKLEADLAAATQARAEAEAERDEAHALFVAIVAEGIAADADESMDPADLGRPSAVLEASRSIAQRLRDAASDEAAIAKAHAAVAEAVHAGRQALGGRVDLAHELSDRGWWLLRTFADGIRRSAREYVEMLAKELDAARGELREEEQRLFDETLTGSIRESVAERIRRSNHLVDRINAELSKVRTATAGVQVRLRWDVDSEQPHAVRSARRLLLKDPADLADADREALYEFFRARIEQVRAELEVAVGWEERLRAVLDYRIWHRFTLEIAHRDWDGFMQATSGRIQRLSTGERSLALHLPMLASIAAHYAAGSNGHEAPCPRLILLDELFAGVDITNRAQLFELFVTWDLDAVLTSDHEWCAYQTLDGIAIHHLHADGDEPVTSSRFVWDGRRRVSAAVQ